jgi:integrase
MGLGPVSAVTLAEARQRAAAERALVSRGIDPLDARRAAALAETSSAATFRVAAERYIADQRAGWTNPKHGNQWLNTLAAYAFPKLGDKACRDITVADVADVLRPLWTAKVETARRVRGRIEAIISAVHATEGWEPYRNPAAWRDNLDRIFPKRSKVAPVRHFPALAYKDAPLLYARLRSEASGMGALALEWTILTAARTMMTRGAMWSEIDEAGRVWTVPTKRVIADDEDGETGQNGSGLKGAPVHRIPLSDAAMRVLDTLRPLRHPTDGGFLFPGTRPGTYISNATMAATLRRLGVAKTVHGFRSTFRDWAAEETTHHPDIAEMALAHALPGGGTRSAYQRGELFAKRRILMDDWAKFLAQPTTLSPTRVKETVDADLRSGGGPSSLPLRI